MIYFTWLDLVLVAVFLTAVYIFVGTIIESIGRLL